MKTKEVNHYIAIIALFIALAIALGAFAAHALKDSLSDYQRSIYQTASFYHFVSGIGCFLIVLTRHPAAKLPFLLNLIGGLVFSGSLYLLAVTGIKALGMITPIGGSLMILAWCYFAYRLFKS